MEGKSVREGLLDVLGYQVELVKGTLNPSYKSLSEFGLFRSLSNLELFLCLQSRRAQTRCATHRNVGESHKMPNSQEFYSFV